MTEILLIAVVVLVFFGGNKIPELMRGLGKGMREFNDAKNNVRREIEDGMREVNAPPKAPVTAATTAEVAPEVTTPAAPASEINLEKNV